MRELRAAGALHARRFEAAADAVAAFLACPVATASDLFWEVDDAHSQSGFFVGLPSHALCRECLEHGFESFALVRGDLTSGALLDHAFDDPVFGSFYETECW